MFAVPTRRSRRTFPVPCLASLAWLILAAPVHAVPGPTPAASARAALLSAPVLDRALLESAVLAANPRLAAARAAWSAAAARSRASGRWLAPTLDASLAPGTLSSGSTGASYRVAVSQEIPLFGRLGLERDAMTAESRSLREDYRGAALQLLDDTRGLYFELCRVSAGRELARQSRELLDEARRGALSRYESGAGSMQEPLRLESELGMLEHELAALDSREAEARARLAALLHLDDSAALRLPPAPADPGAAAGDPNPDGAPGATNPVAEMKPVPGAVSTDSPELAGARARLEAAQARATLADRSRLPSVRLEAGFDRFMNMPDQRPMLGLGVSLPFLWGRAGAEARAARLDAGAAQLRIAAARDHIAAETDAAVAAVAESAHEGALLRASVVPAAEEAARAARLGYATGRVELADLLMTERALVEARTSERRARIDLEQARAGLARARGELPELAEVKP